MESELENSDEELAIRLKKLITKREEFSRQSNLYKNQLNAVSQKLTRQRARLRQMTESKGRMEGQIEENKQRKVNLHKKICSLAIRHEIQGFDKANFSDHDVSEFCNMMLNIQTEKTGNFRRIQTEHQNSAQRFRNLLETLVSQKSEAEAKCKQLLEARQDLERSSRQKRNEIETCSRELNSNFNGVDRDLSNKQEELQKKRQEMSSSTVSNELNSLDKEKQRNSQNVRRLRDVEDNLKAQDRQSTRVNMLKTQVEKLSKNVDEKMEAISEDIMSLLMDGVPDKDELEIRISDRLKDLETTLSKARENLSRTKQSISGLSGQLKNRNKDSQKLERGMEKVVREIKSRNLDLNKDIDEMILKKKLDVENRTGDHSFVQQAQTMYIKFNKQAKSHHKCPVCLRAFHEEEEQKFLEKNKDRLEKIKNGNVIEKKKQILEKTRKDLERLYNCREFFVEHRKLSKDLNEKRKELRELKEKSETYSSRLENVTREEKSTRIQVESARKVRQKSATVISSWQSLKEKQKYLQDQIDSLDRMSAGGDNLKEIKEKIRKLDQRNSDLEVRLNSLRKKKDNAQAAVSELEQKVFSLKSLTMKKKELEDKKRALKLDVREIERKKTDYASQEKTFDEKIKPLSEEILTKKKQFEEQRNRQMNKENAEREIVSAFRSDVNKIKEMKQEIDDFNQKEKDLEKLLINVKANMESLNGLEEKEKDLREKSNDAATRMPEVIKSIGLIQANVKYRKAVETFNLCQTQVGGKVAEITNLGDEKELQENVVQYRADLEGFNENIAHIKGSIENDRNRAVDLMTTLKSEKYHKVNERHRAKMIEVETTQMANQDLDIFQKALDRALIQFHKEKMREINDVLKELWQTTYRGQDIDYVRLQSENSSSKKKSYNYAVMMVQGDTEMEMRGRCSAGQRVLASLLIRMALAETFCLKCGLLALDEPTTNLDEANIKALAQALTQIIKRRQSQKNFQLIIITHDEQFVEHLGQRAFCDYYYRVYKNEHQKSQATLHSFDTDGVRA